MIYVKTQRLSDYAASRLAKENVDGDEIKEIINKLKRKKTTAEIFSIFFTLFFGLLFLYGFVLLFAKLSKIDSFLDFLGTSALVLLAISAFFMPRYIQTRKRFLTRGRPYEVDLPPPIETLLRELASKNFLILTRKKAPGSSSVWQNSDNIFFDTALEARDFENRFAPILLSANENDYPNVLLNKAIGTHPIHIALGSDPKGEDYAPQNIEERKTDDEELLPNPPPHAATSYVRPKRRSPPLGAKAAARSKPRYETHWLLAIPEAQFEAFLEAAAKARKWEHIDAPRKLRIVLVAARKSAHQQRENTGSVSITQMRIASVAALEEAFANEPGAFIGLTGKQGDRSANSDNWIDLVLRMTGDAAYSEIRQVAIRFTPQASECHESDA